MFEENQFVVYKNDVCKVKEIKLNYFNGKDYYSLAPIEDESLTIDVPVENKGGLIRKLISKEKVEEIIKEIPDIEVISDNNRMLENEYKQLLKTREHLDLIKIIKTTFMRNNKRKEAGKKIGEKDRVYFRLAERLLYNEFSLVLGMSYEATKKYVTEKVMELLNE